MNLTNMTSDSIKVAVRVRPFSMREIVESRHLIVIMDENLTTIIDPKDLSNRKTFTFDFSYWSFDEFEEDSNGIFVPDSPYSRYASQQKVFDDLGRDILDNAMQGFDCTLFAYGQTGTGKSYSVVGYDPNKGIAPQTCDELFKFIENGDSTKKFSVTFSMMEIYNENLRDLLGVQPNSIKGLTIRESDKLGFYVVDLTKFAVKNYTEINDLMDKGTAHRTVVATQMNSTSSRSHMVIQINISQVINVDGVVKTKFSTINLVDLAGSEWANKTGVTGSRLQDANINKSILALGHVIRALSKSANAERKQYIPYRDSALTKLLKNAFGGKSKTTMIASISPSDDNYEETLNTLTFAEIVKKTKNFPVVNEHSMEQMIQELNNEKKNLLTLLNGEIPSSVDTQGMTEDDIRTMTSTMTSELQTSIERKSKLLELYEGDIPRIKLPTEVTSHLQKDFNKQTFSYFTNLNPDFQLSKVLSYGFQKGETILGKQQQSMEVTNDTLNHYISGPGIQRNHAIVKVYDDDKIITIAPCSTDSLVKVNGTRITAPTNLKDLDRVLLGSNNIYIFHNPISQSLVGKCLDWEAAQKEIAIGEGFSFDDMSSVGSDVIQILPIVNEMNAIALEMDKKRKFDLLIVHPKAQNVVFGMEAHPKVMVKLTNLLNGNSWLLNRDQCINRRYVIQSLYQRFLEGENLSQLSTDEDPFWEPLTEIQVGRSYVFLQNLYYNLGLEHDIAIVDYKGMEEGRLKVKVEPCNEKGDVNNLEPFTDDGLELLNKPYFFKVSIDSMEVYKTRFIHGNFVRFSVFKDEEVYETQRIENTLNPFFKYNAIVEIPSVTNAHLEYFNHGYIVFSVFGIQKDDTDNNKSKTKEPHSNQIESILLLNKVQIQNNILTIKNKHLTQKLNQIKQICIDWSAKPEEQQQFDPFYRSVATVAFSTGDKIKFVAKSLGKVIVSSKIIKGVVTKFSYKSEKQQEAQIIISGKSGENGNSEICIVM